MGTSQGEALCVRRDHAADSFYLADKELDHQSLDNMTSSRTGQAEAHASGSHRSHVVEEARKGSPVEELRVYGSLWQVGVGVGVDNRSTYRAENSSVESRLPCMLDIPVVSGNPWRAGSYRSRGHRCGDFHDARFPRGWDIPYYRVDREDLEN